MWNAKVYANKGKREFALADTILCLIYRLSWEAEGLLRHNTGRQGMGWEENPAWWQMDVLECSKDQSKHGITGIVLNPTQKTCCSHLWAFENKLSVGRHELHLCQRAETIDPCGGRQWDWVTTCDHCSFVQPAEDMRITLVIQPLTGLPVLYQDVFWGFFVALLGSMCLFAVCCDVFLATCVNLPLRGADRLLGRCAQYPPSSPPPILTKYQICRRPSHCAVLLPGRKTRKLQSDFSVCIHVHTEVILFYFFLVKLAFSQ